MTQPSPAATGEVTGAAVDTVLRALDPEVLHPRRIHSPQASRPHLAPLSSLRVTFSLFSKKIIFKIVKEFLYFFFPLNVRQRLDDGNRHLKKAGGGVVYIYMPAVGGAQASRVWQLSFSVACSLVEPAWGTWDVCR